MKQIVTDLKFQKRNPGRAGVYLDHCFAFTVNMLDAAGLSTGQVLDKKSIERLRQKHENHVAYAFALRYLGYRPRSRRELERYLSRKGVSPESSAQALSRLAAEGYVNDADYARFHVDNRIRFRPRAKAVLRMELAQKGIDGAFIDAALADVDDEKLALKSIEIKLQRWTQIESENTKKRIIGFLQRRGFSLAVALKTYRLIRSDGARQV